MNTEKLLIDNTLSGNMADWARVTTKLLQHELFE